VRDPAARVRTRSASERGAARRGAARAAGQQRSQAGVHNQHGAEERMKAARAGDVAIIGAPGDLQPRVHPLDRRAALVTPLELLAGPWNGREAAQVQFEFNPDGSAAGPARV
jgi:hypothetical protein